jgi:hypothetical protein
MKISHILPSILLAVQPDVVQSAISLHPVVTCRSINNPTDKCTFQRAEELGTWFRHNLAATSMGCTLASIITGEEQAQVEALYEDSIDPSRTRIWMGAIKKGNGNGQMDPFFTIQTGIEMSPAIKPLKVMLT